MYFNNFNFNNENDWLDSINDSNFESNALLLFKFQYQYNSIYKAYVDLVCTNINSIDRIDKIPFLPIHFFKTHQVTIGNLTNATIFESSGTTQTINSKHYV